MPNVGGILSPKLKDISSIGDNAYQSHLSILLMDLKSFFAMINHSEDYERLTDDEKLNISAYDLFIQDARSAILLQNALNFFVKEDVEYSPEEKVFVVKSDVVVKEQDKMVEKHEITGVISRENYRDVVDVICQRNNIKTRDIGDPDKVKNKKALAIMKKLKKGREEMAKTSKADKNMELGNIISAVANRSQSLNIVNIWDLTVFQLWDSFARLTNNNIYDISAASVSAWGDKDKKFDFNGWYKKLSN